MSNIESTNSGVVLALIVIFIISGLFIWDKRQAREDCELRANTASVETYPMNEYPDTNERARLQSDYEQRYLESG